MDKKDELFIEETIIKVCSEVDIDPDADLFEGSGPGEDGFSLTYRELLKIILIQNWEPENSQFYSKRALSSEGLRRFLRNAKIKSGLMPSDRLEGYLNTARKFFKYRIFISEPREALLLLKEIEFQSVLDTPLLISGEPGTGKKVIAKVIHENGPQKKSSFKVVKCQNLSDELQYGEIFGYEKGVFTDATTDSRGTISECDGGTVYIDEILCLGPKTQIALSTLLGENKYKRLGSSEYLAANCRIIFGTKGWDNNISNAVSSGKYSYLRNHLSLPIRRFPLRFGRVNIPLIIYLYTRKLAKDNVYFPDFLIKEWLTTNPFPGNYSQLISEIEYYVSKYLVWQKKESKANGKGSTSIKQRKGYLYSELLLLAFRDEYINYFPRSAAIEKESDRKIISLSDIVYNPILRFALKYKDENGKTQFDLSLYENISTPSIFAKYTELLETYDKIKIGELDINIDINSKDPYLNPFLGMESFLDWLRIDKKDFLYVENEEDIQPKYPVEEYDRTEAEVDEPADQNIWHKDGVAWRISYEGIPAKIQDLVGLTYIGHLLQDPFKEFSLVELDELVNPGKVDLDSPAVKKLGAEDSFEMLSSTDKKPRYEESTDEKSIEAYKKEIKKLEAKIRYTEATGNDEEAQQLREEKESVEGYLNESTSFVSKKPLLKVPELEYIRKRIYNDVRYSIKIINKEHKPLASHLRQFIKIRKYSQYMPSPEISWDIQL